MKTLISSLMVLALWSTAANGQILIGGSLNNGNLDRTHATEIVPGFFLPKPDIWVYQGTRSITGPYNDGLSSEAWAGPAPTPVTTDGLLNGPPPDGYDGPDGGVFFKAFSGNATDGSATIDLYQDNPATPGSLYTLTGWAGAEANYMATASVFALDFLDAGGNPIAGGATLDLVAAGLFTANGQPFNYKQYTLSALAPAGAVSVRARVSMIDGLANPLGGGQAFVVDDFELSAVPEPSAVALAGLGLFGLLASRRRH